MQRVALVCSTVCALFALACGSQASDATPDGAASGGGGSAQPADTAGANVATAGETSSAGSDTAGTDSMPSSENFSFFLTSLKAMTELSGSSDGFGGDLSFGETGTGAGLRGADKICAAIAEKSMPGNAKTWRAFLSATQGDDGQPVNAIDRVGTGPWYDRTGRLLAQNVTDLVGERPVGADMAIINDLPNEDGVPNHAPSGSEVDNHDVLTGTNEQGQLFSTDPGFTCNDWTSSVDLTGTPHCGHSWPRMGFGGGGGPGGGGGGGGPGGPGGGGMMGGFGGGFGGGMMGSGTNWMSALNEAGCAPGAFIIEKGPPGANGTKSVGDGGGYGGIYCFALSP